MITPQLPVAVKRNADLFEIGFVFLLLPMIVATMDRPPFFLGGKLLLWMGTWFLVRRLSEADRAKVLASLSPWRKPFPAAMVLLGLAAAGSVLAGLSGLDRFELLEPGVRWVSGALLLPIFALVISLPLAILAWGYLPVRFADSHWLPGWLVAVLPALGFASLHMATLGWKAPLAALVLGAGAWLVSRGRLPLLPTILAHAVVGWIGVVGGLW